MRRKATQARQPGTLPSLADGAGVSATHGFAAARRREAARELNTLREHWLNPPEWTREEILKFPATPGGPWAHFIDQSEIRSPTPHSAIAKYPRLVPTDAKADAELKKRTLTSLYNQRPAWLAHAHASLDAAVADTYGFPPDLGEPEILAKLLKRNAETQP